MRIEDIRACSNFSSIHPRHDIVEALRFAVEEIDRMKPLFDATMSMVAIAKKMTDGPT